MFDTGVFGYMSSKKLDTTCVSVDGGKHYIEVECKRAVADCDCTTVDYYTWDDFDFAVRHFGKNDYPWIKVGTTRILRRPCIIITTRYRGKIYVTYGRMKKHKLIVRIYHEPIWTLG